MFPPIVRKFQSEIVLLACIIAILGYALPWLYAPGASLRVGAYDLAEWLTLHPVVRSISPFMLPALALRAVPVVLVAFMATYASAIQKRWVKFTMLALVAGLLIAMLPPLEMFIGNWKDPNYQQQFTLWILTVAAIVLFYRWQFPLPLYGGLLALAIWGTIWGTYRGFYFMALYDIPISIGSGAFFFAAGLSALGVMLVQKRMRQER